MGLFDSITGLFDSAVSSPVTTLLDVGQSALGGFDSGSGGSPFPVAYQPQYQFSTPQTLPTYPAMTVQNPVQIGAVVAGGMRLATKFPALYAALVALAQQFGRKFTPEMLRTMVRKFGIGLVAGLIGIGALQELSVWESTHKRRRMNVANTHALRRSLRRLKGFERLSHKVSAQLGRAAGRRSSRRSGRCMTCRKSPCCC